MTHHEKIKAMSAEKLAEIIADSMYFCETCDGCPAHYCCVLNPNRNCTNNIKEWLESEVEEDG